MCKEIKSICDESRIRPDASEVAQLRCDNSKLLKHSSWKPDYTLEEGLKETIS